MPMTYTQLFRSLREARKLTHDGLAQLAGCHRNTVINVECGRPVKFKTIAELMLKMGYGTGSEELKSIALLWLEAISGIDLTQDRSLEETRKRIAKYRATEKEAAQLLAHSVITERLTVEQIRALLFASGRSEVISILENIRDLLTKAEIAPEVQTTPPLQTAEGN